MYELFINIHIWASILFSLTAVVLLLYYTKSLVSGDEFLKIHLFLENAFIVLLYFGLILGIILYFFIRPGENDQMTLEQAKGAMSSRFWSIEHFSVMLFALMLAQIGKIFTVRSTLSKDKLKYALFYYGSATIVTFISTGFYLYYRV
ncbi:MAG: hypothetical protein L3J74_15660 [Bacteroidales bacterium]|nr:hypothetical protein [Bacteroidales bacterium]